MVYRSAISIGAVLAILLLVLMPERLWTDLPAVCAFRGLFGIECLGCGMTRALAAAAHGDLSRALAFNAGVVLVGPLLIIAAVQGLRLPR